MRSTYLPLLASGLAIALISIAHLSMSLPEDELGPGVSRATLVRRRLHSRYAHLERRLHSLVSLRRELQDSVTEQQKQAAAAVAAAALQPRGNHTSNGREDVAPRPHGWRLGKTSRVPHTCAGPIPAPTSLAASRLYSKDTLSWPSGVHSQQNRLHRYVPRH